MERKHNSATVEERNGDCPSGDGREATYTLAAEIVVTYEASMSRRSGQDGILPVTDLGPAFNAEGLAECNRTKGSEGRKGKHVQKSVDEPSIYMENLFSP